MDQRIAQYRLTGELVKVHPSLQAAAGISMVPKAAIEKALGSKTGAAKGYLWRRVEESVRAEAEIPRSTIDQYAGLRKPVAHYNLAGELQGTYPSRSAAAKALDLAEPQICRQLTWANAESRRVGVHHFRNWDGRTSPPKNLGPIPIYIFNKPVAQYDLQGKWLANYETLTAGAVAAGLSHSAIGIAASAPNRKAGGYMWRKYSEDVGPPKEVEPYIRVPTQAQLDLMRPVVQVDPATREEIAVYMSMAEAARTVGVTRQAIQQAVDGITTYSAGYAWKDLDGFEEN